MGLFLQMAAVAAPAGVVKDALAARDGMSVPEDVFDYPANKTLVVFDHYALDIEDICRQLSADLEAPVLYLHVHDGALWMYQLFVAGDCADQFNTIPDYWENLSAEEMKRWQGSAETLARHWPDVPEEAIERYLICHSEDRTDLEEKAYASDTYPRWDCWQIADFMAKLGVPYPEYKDHAESKGFMGKPFSFNFDSAIVLALGCYGIYASMNLTGAFRPGGMIFAVLMIASGLIGFYAKKPAQIAAAILMLVIALFGAYQSITTGFTLRRILVFSFGLGAAAYLYRNRD